MASPQTLDGAGRYYGRVYGRLYRLGYHSKRNYSHSRSIVARVERGELAVETVLDIGCSTGWAMAELGRLGKQAVGIDVAPAAIQKGQRNGLDVRLASATSLPFEDGQFELVMSTDCFEHLRPADVESAVSEAWRVSSRYLALKVNPRSDRNWVWKLLAGTSLHLTLQPVQWWIEQFTRRGGRLVDHDMEAEEFVIEKPTIA